MIITSIKLINFQCYSGEHKFEFTEGLNLIIGDNTAGKSKLYDAFYWVLHDKIPSYKYQYTHLIKEKFVNEYSKSVADEKQAVEARVELTFKDSRSEYQLIRAYSVWHSNGVWNAETKSREKAFRKDVLEFKPYPDVDFVKSLIMKDTFEKYMWFQGEQIENILDFDKPETLRTAIEVLSGVKRFDDIKKITNEALKAATDELTTQLNRSRTTNTKAEKISSQIKKAEKDLEIANKNWTSLNNEIIKLQKRRDELQRFEIESRELDRLNTQIQNDRKIMEQTVNSIEKDTYGFNKNIFLRYWLLANVKPIHQLFEERFEAYRSERELRRVNARVEQEKQEMALRPYLPEGTPDERYIRKMLKERICHVCNRPFEEHSEAEKFVGLHLTSTKTTLLKMERKLDNRGAEIEKELRSLDKLAQEKCKNKDEIISEIKEYIDRMDAADSQFKEIEGRIKKSESEKEQILNSIPTNQTEGAITQIGTELVTIERDFSANQKKLGSIEKTIEELTKDLEKAKTELRDLANKNLSSPKYQQVESILKALNSLANRTRDRVFNELIQTLEAKANEHYEVMTVGNTGFRGRIKLENVSKGTDEYVPKIISSRGVETTALNQANMTLVKLALIMAIISGRKSSDTAQLYPLISDAPTSTFSEGYILGFCKRVSEVYGQSIIMTKDFYYNHSLRDQVLSEVQNMGNAYIIESSNKEAGREDLASTNTKITKIR